MKFFKNNIIKYLGLLVLAAFLIYKFYLPILRISLPFILSLLFAYLLGPIVEFFIKRKISRSWSIVLTYLLVVTLAILILSFILPVFYANLADLIVKSPYIIERYKILASEFTIRYELSSLPESIKNSISFNIGQVILLFNQMITDILNGIANIVSNAFYIVLIPFITFYILKDKEYLKERAAYLVPRRFREDTIVTWYQIDLVLKQFIRGELIVAIIVGILTSMAMYIIGVKFPLVLGFIAGITNIIPYVGPFLGVIPVMLVVLAENPALVLKVIIAFFIIHQLESGIISPKIVGAYVGLHPITIIFVILLSEQIFGLIGMFFAVPAATIIIIIVNKLLDGVISNNRQ